MPGCARRVTGGDTTGVFIEKARSESPHAAQWEMRKSLLQNGSPACVAKCSATGPRISAKRKVGPPAITITPVSRETKRMPVAARREDGVMSFASSDPAIASTPQPLNVFASQSAIG